MIAPLALALSRFGAAASILLSASVALAFFTWMLFVLAAELDSIHVALVVTTIVLLPLASPLSSLGRRTRR